MPSPRDIPRVKKAWQSLPYDKFIVKYKPQRLAYAEGREFFLDHEEYTHIVICADDLVIEPEQLEELLKSCGLQLDGICNLDESMPDTWAIQPIGCDLSGPSPKKDYGRWYMTNEEPKLPDVKYLQVGHSGAACRVMNRSLFKKLSFTGSENGEGWFDFQMSKEMKQLGLRIMVNTKVRLWHMRTTQMVDKTNLRDGYTEWIQR